MCVSCDSVHTDRCSGSPGTCEAQEPEAIHGKAEHEVAVNLPSNDCFTTMPVLLKLLFFFTLEIFCTLQQHFLTDRCSSLIMSQRKGQAYRVICVFGLFHSTHGVLYAKTEYSASPAQELIAPDSYLHLENARDHNTSADTEIGKHSQRGLYMCRVTEYKCALL